jgi:hypothetical protein
MGSTPRDVLCMGYIVIVNLQEAISRHSFDLVLVWSVGHKSKAPEHVQVQVEEGIKSNC